MRESWASWRAALVASQPAGRDADAFAERSRASTLRNLRHGAVVLATAIVLAWPLDLLLDSQAARSLALFRLFCPALAVVYGLGFAKIDALRRRPDLAFSGIVLVTIVGCACNAERAGLDLPWIDHCYLLPFVTVLSLSGFRRRLTLTAAVTGAFVLSYFVLFPGERASPDTWSFVLTMIVASLVSVTIGHIVWTLSWRQFTLARDLERAKLGLEQQVMWQTRELDALTERATALHAAERRRVADVLGGRTERLVEHMRAELDAMESRAAGAPTLERVVRLTEDLRASTRGIVSNLWREPTPGGDLAASLEQLVATMRPLPTTELDAEIDPKLVDVDPRVARAAYRVAQEALTNAIRHASASRIVVRAATVGPGMVLEICDDGIGIGLGRTSDPAPAPGSGHGLLSMRERARDLGATLDIESLAAGGTRVSLALADRGRPRPSAAQLGPAPSSS
ncbi:sensor histidine kinase [Enhygromyxa salina]|uniref:histidine kinase n=1 Tax=Enhygromyxa salina TaxID=215803 RepID=A0A2S9YSI7_9BACT|nr:ATP-binding protein [Enhygromyxa salina]PRQ08075.1 Sensor protein VraS [Enhygromyxa salina]